MISCFYHGRRRGQHGKSVDLIKLVMMGTTTTPI
jgi:hypothetical protein